MPVQLGLTITIEPERKLRRMARAGSLVGKALIDEFDHGFYDVSYRALQRVIDFTPLGRGDRGRRGGEHLRDMWYLEPIRGGRGYRVVSRAERSPDRARQLKAIEDGSRPHVIRARRGRRLAFEAGEGLASAPNSISEGGNPILFRREVRHPGNKPYAMVRLARGLAALDLIELKAKIARMARQLWLDL